MGQGTNRLNGNTKVAGEPVSKRDDELRSLHPSFREPVLTGVVREVPSRDLAERPDVVRDHEKALRENRKFDDKRVEREHKAMADEKLEENPRGVAKELEHDIESIRHRLDMSLTELDRRRHQMTDWRLQLRQHPQVLVIAGLAVAAIAGGIGYAIYAARRREEPVQKARRVRIAVGRAVDHPEHVAKGQPTVIEKVIGAVGVTVATTLAKRALDAMWSQEPRTVPPV